MVVVLTHGVALLTLNTQAYMAIMSAHQQTRWLNDHDKTPYVPGHDNRAGDNIRRVQPHQASKTIIPGGPVTL